jgi:hypothetical protein
MAASTGLSDGISGVEAGAGVSADADAGVRVMACEEMDGAGVETIGGCETGSD